MASCSWGQPPDNYESDETESESDSSESDLDISESDNTDYDISDFDLESEGKNSLVTTIKLQISFSLFRTFMDIKKFISYICTLTQM